MSTLDHVYNWTLLVLLMAGLVSVLWTLPKVPAWWKPLYWLGVPLAGLSAFIFLAVTVEEVFHFAIVPRSSLLPILKLVLFILALQLIAVPFVHRLEGRELERPVSLPDLLPDDHDLPRFENGDPDGV